MSTNKLNTEDNTNDNLEEYPGLGFLVAYLLADMSGSKIGQKNLLATETDEIIDKIISLYKELNPSVNMKFVKPKLIYIVNGFKKYIVKKCVE